MSCAVAAAAVPSIIPQRRGGAGRALARGPGLAVLFVLVGSLVLPGCASAPAPAKVSGSISAAATLNPSVSRRPSPLRMVIYELKSAAAFNKADFMSLYQSDQAALGGELVAREELVLQPGEKRDYARTLASETRFLGFFAVYRDLERATWRTVVAVQPGKAQKLDIQAGTLAVSVATPP